jgi:hypothetical protein
MPKTARQAVETAINASTTANHIDIQRFWMSLWESGYEVVERPGPASTPMPRMPKVAPLDNDGGRDA